MEIRAHKVQGARSKSILMWHYYSLFTYQLWTGHKEIGPTVMYVIYVMYATQSLLSQRNACDATSE